MLVFRPEVLQTDVITRMLPIKAAELITAMAVVKEIEMAYIYGQDGNSLRSM